MSINTDVNITLNAETALAEIERLIVTFRYARNLEKGERERDMLDILKWIASDMRGDTTAAVGEAQRQLQYALEGLKASPEDPGKATRVAQELVARWPTVRQALEFFEDARKVDAQ